MDDLLTTFHLINTLLFVLCVQLVCSGVAAALRKPMLAAVGAAIVAAAVTAVTVLLAVPGGAGPFMAAVLAAAIGMAVFHLTNLSIERGKTIE